MLKLLLYIFLACIVISVVVKYFSSIIIIGIIALAFYLLWKRYRNNQVVVSIGESTQKALKLPVENFVVLDIETTGLSRSNDYVIEIAANEYVGRNVVKQYHTYVNPGVHIPAAITRLTGISDATVMDAPSIVEIKKDFLKFIGKKPIVGHNITSFDVPFLRNHLNTKLNNRLYDTLYLSKRAFPGLPCYKLPYLNQALHLGGQESHRAASDIAVNIELFLACCNPEHYRHYLEDAEALAAIPIESGITPFPNIDIHSFVPSCSGKLPSTGLTGKTVVFTGELSILPEKAMQMAVDAGAELKSCVSKKVDYLVVGTQDIRLVGPSGRSNKQRYADELIQNGNDRLRVIDEAEFLELLKPID